MRSTLRALFAMPFVAATLVASAPATGSEPVGSGPVLVADDGTRVELEEMISIVSETVNGVTLWHETSTVDVPTRLLVDPVALVEETTGVDLNEYVVLDPVDPGEVSMDELAAPSATDLVPATDDPLAPVTGVDIVGMSDGEYIEQCQQDGAIAVRSCLTMNYYSYWSGSRNYVRLLSYVHQWTRLDNTVAWSNAIARAGVMGPSRNGNHYGAAVEKKIGTPVNNATYTHKPSWTGVDIQVNGIGYYQGANNEIKLKRGTRTWELVHENVYKGSNPPF